MPDLKRFVLVTGLSGAGKSQALRFLEDLGYYCVDNLPPALVPTIAELTLSEDSSRTRVAVCVDARGGDDLANLPAYLDAASQKGVRPETLFLESSDTVLLRRYSESRRRHPASPEGTVEDGIQRERDLLAPIRAKANLILDTSTTSVGQLRERVAAVFGGARTAKEMSGFAAARCAVCSPSRNATTAAISSAVGWGCFFGGICPVCTISETLRQTSTSASANSGDS